MLHIVLTTTKTESKVITHRLNELADFVKDCERSLVLLQVIENNCMVVVYDALINVIQSSNIIQANLHTDKR